MKLYREAAKAEALAIAKASPTLSAAARDTGIPRTTLRQWQNEPQTSLLTAEQRQLGQKAVAERVEHARSLYLDRMIEPDAVKATSGYYAGQTVRSLTEVHQLLTGGPTHRIDLATFLSSRDDQEQA